MEKVIKVKNEIALLHLISDISVSLYPFERASMLGPNEMIHLMYWILGYNKGIRTIKKMIKFLEEKMYDGKKNKGIYAVKDALTKKGWLSFDDDFVIISNEIFNFENEIILEKTIKYEIVK